MRPIARTRPGLAGEEWGSGPKTGPTKGTTSPTLPLRVPTGIHRNLEIRPWGAASQIGHCRSRGSGSAGSLTQRMRQTARVIAVDRRSIPRFDLRFQGANLREQLLFPGLILREREPIVERRRSHLVEADAVPRLEIRKTSTGVAGAADDQRHQDENYGGGGAPGPAPERGHDKSLREIDRARPGEMIQTRSGCPIATLILTP